MFVLLQDARPDVSGISAGSSCIACEEKKIKLENCFFPLPFFFPIQGASLVLGGFWRCLMAGRALQKSMCCLLTCWFVVVFFFLFVAGLLWS